ncbi:MAG TPA: SDR family NAD(P)-dependent oxidoreductase [Fibrobacteria bacterium]|nr:SDR family NAD(P)-dependent oxidoreductase [Fibrobacteria bacterium]HOX51348.1 SDR family NAD(P)-dependent oxidoreductase [Fibrobacteria bacterium]
MSHRHLALITGASSGIGAAYARLLAREGHDLWLVARRGDRLEALAEEFSALGVQVRVDVRDLADASQLAALSEDVRSCGGLSVLVHNAGFGVRGEVGEASAEKLLAMATVHVDATIALTSAAVPAMREKGRGAIVVVASIAGRLVGSGSATYCATKSFEISYTRSLCRELSWRGVSVQALCPGYTRTEFHDTPEYAHWDRNSVPSWLWTTAEEVATASWRNRHREVCVPGWGNKLVWCLAGVPVVGWIRERIRRAKLR